MKTRKILIALIGAGILAGVLFFLLGCGGEGDGEAGLPSYGGTDPKGDYIVVIVDRDNSQVKKINFTEGETEGAAQWMSYTAVAADSEYASGFSIVNTIDIGEGEVVLFAEYPGAACVYLRLDAEGNGKDNPVFLVAREAPAASSFYSRAYNWVKFHIDPTGTDSDMGCGFAAFDASGEAGKMYGASYSKKEDFLDGGDGDGLSNINDSGDAGIDALSWDAGSCAFCIWNSDVGDWTQAMAVTGTASGALVLDWGTGMGGGGALAIPQTSAVDTLTTFWPTVTGTYLTMTYGYTQGVGAEIGPAKVVISNDGEDGFLNVYDYDYKTMGGGFLGTPVSLTKLEGFEGGPVVEEAICVSFAAVAGNEAATSTVVNNAHLCQGAFIAQYIEPEVSELLIMMAFDPSGRYFGFTMFEVNYEMEYFAIRFGLGIKDPNYDDTKAQSMPD